MSREADVAFMKIACGDIAEARAPGGDMAQRTYAVLRALRTRNWHPTENRIYELIKGKSRRIDGFEKDRARAVLKKIEAENVCRKNTEHLLWLQSQVAGLKETSDPDFVGGHVDALEQVIRNLGRETGSMGLLSTTGGDTGENTD